MQLIAGGRRKNTIGARTASARLGGPAIQANDHLHQCVVYIDLNMVRAGSGQHPREWEHSEYREIHKPPSRYGIIDLLELHALFAFADTAQFQETHGHGLNRHLLDTSSERIGGRKRSLSAVWLVENVRSELGSN